MNQAATTSFDQETGLDPREYSLLIVDNDKAHARAMTESLERVGYRCTVATSGPEGIQKIDQNVYHVVISDLVMNDIDGMQVLQRAKRSLPDCEVVLVTGHATVSKAVEAMQEGAFTFLEKPITPGRLRAVASKAIEACHLKQTNTELRQRLDEKFGFEGIIYASQKMQEVIERIKRIAPTDATVLITGESGTGKEMIAQAIHQNSPRKNRRMKALNVRAVSETLVESELFGHVKGAFTDAASDRIGAFEYADGGTLFLDEVGDMPMSTQIKLLRVLEEHRITRVGDNKSIKVNCRLLSATNRPLEQMVDEGTFRNDLYYRLNIVTVHIPALRERPDDVVPLMDHFRKMFIKRHGKSPCSFAPAVTRRFYSYSWPGNIRQLRNFVETMVVLDTDGVLDLNDLPPELSEASDLSPTTGSESADLLPSAGDSSLIGRTMNDIERWAIEETLRLTAGNRDEAAKILSIGARTLYRKLDKYKQEDGDAPEEPEDDTPAT
ncbi:sigma-54-dependent transcriptional regulator [Aureliella helgolandensis]|uniref:DNA-binding transcriptional response regulator n=1 Tax=Aureliella helgolandensis TaxID=2527968 RepID=A0A518G8V9_9BACT|nr:sigma-54 dependent transcriptional regulator [Aureliella helgolandensis]QDV24999.1 DNA-binding transcriptional response regulator [Aureliella helgolandensis]